MEYKDRLEYITDSNGDRYTINAGNADHDGLEISWKYKFNDQWSFSASGTFASNEWVAPSEGVEEIFSVPVEEIVGKKVAGSPQTMIYSELSYDNDIWYATITFNYWTDYYANHFNSNVEPDSGFDIIGLNDNGTLPSFNEWGIIHW